MRSTSFCKNHSARGGQTKPRRPARPVRNPAALRGQSQSFSSPKFFSAVSSCCCTAGDGGHSGRRSGPASQPRRFIAHLTGIGFTSANSACTSSSAPQLQRAAARGVAVQPGGADIVRILRRHVGKHADDALAAQRHDRQDQPVLAGIDIQLIPAQRGDLADLGQVAAGFLDAVYVGQLAQLGQRCGQDVAAGAAGDVVQDAGQRNGVRDRGKNARSAPAWLALL